MRADRQSLSAIASFLFSALDCRALRLSQRLFSTVPLGLEICIARAELKHMRLNSTPTDQPQGTRTWHRLAVLHAGDTRLIQAGRPLRTTGHLPVPFLHGVSTRSYCYISKCFMGCSRRSSGLSSPRTHCFSSRIGGRTSNPRGCTSFSDGGRACLNPQ
jgi:hypothetical protein